MAFGNVTPGQRKPIEHGTAGYSRGCRCEVCLGAMREYNRARRRREHLSGGNPYPLKRACECDAPQAMADPQGEMTCVKCGHEVAV